jgi:sugar O-acyltransferase (sialic acid O-acetyltransferase NeuD family)
MAQQIIIIGAGGHGASVAETISFLPHFDLVGFVDDSIAPSQTILGKPILGPVDAIVRWRDGKTCAVVAIGGNTVRERLQEQLTQWQFEIATIIHPRAFVAPSAALGSGCVVLSGAQVGTLAQLGRGVIVNTGAVVDHHCVVADFGHLGTNACMAGGSVLGRGSWLQAGAALGYGVSVDAGEELGVGEARQRAPS